MAQKTGDVVLSAGGVVLKRALDEIQVALVRHANGHWVLPKGHLAENETITEAALREVREETGIDETDLEIVESLGSFPFQEFDDDPRPKINYFLLMMYKGPPDNQLSTDYAHAEAAWHTLPVKVYLRYPYQRTLINKLEQRFRLHSKS